MRRIRADDLIALFERMVEENWRYVPGAAGGNAAGGDPAVDRGGAFAYAFFALGGICVSTDTNSLYREWCDTIDPLPIEDGRPGYLALMMRDWRKSDTSEWLYDPPGNVYNVGLIGRDGVVHHADPSRGMISSPIDQWGYCAPLTMVSYDSEYVGIVEITSGFLHIREKPSTSAKSVGELYAGERVYILGEPDTQWLHIITNDGCRGYCYGQYIRIEEDDEQPTGLDEMHDHPTESDACTTLIRDDGACITLQGKWRVAID